MTKATALRLFTHNPVARLTGGALRRLRDSGPASYVRARARHAGGLAREAGGRVDDAVRLQVARLLNALQIPTARDVHELNRRVAELQAAVERLAREDRPAPAPRKPARRRAQGRRKAA